MEGRTFGGTSNNIVEEPESDDSISQSEVDAFALITPSTFQCDLCEYSNKEQRNLKEWNSLINFF